MFSWKCKGCERPLLSPHSINKVNAWMSEITAVSQAKVVTGGEYDGYGRISGIDIQVDFDLVDRLGGKARPCFLLTGSDRFVDNGDGTMTKVNDSPRDYLTLWHTACWRVAGEPDEFDGHCDDSSDQGMFFEDGEYDVMEPL
jgi:hypothetical protein